MKDKPGDLALINGATCPDVELLQLVALKELTAASNACAAREGEFRSSIIDMLHQCGYELTDCPDGNPNEVSYLEVDAMVNEAIEKCQGLFTAEIAAAQDFGGTWQPAVPCYTEPCYYVDDQGSCITVTRFNYELFDDCTLEKIEQATTWDIAPYNVDDCCTEPAGDRGPSCDPNSEYSTPIPVGSAQQCPQ